MRKIMTRWKVLALLSVTLIGFASPSKAEEAKDFRGTDLYTACTGTPSEQLLCQTYILGFYDALGLWQAAARSEHQTPITCFPNGVTPEQARLIIEKYMRVHPDKLHQPARVIAAVALAAAFPCGR